MRKLYEDLMRQMEQDLRRSEDMLRRVFQTAPATRFWEPAVDVYETEEALQIRVELAGLHPEELEVELSADGKAVVVRGHRRPVALEPGQRVMFHQMEIYFGPFERVIALPPGAKVDYGHIEAHYRDGFLVVSLPKRPAGAAVTSIRVPVNG